MERLEWGPSDAALESSLSNRTIFNGQPLLPNLKHLCWKEGLTDICEVSTRIAFLSPTLASLDLGPYLDYLDVEEGDILALMVPAIQRQAPFLTSLTIRGPYNLDSVVPLSTCGRSFLDITETHRELEHIHMDQILFASVVQSLPPLPKLRELHLEAFSDWDFDYQVEFSSIARSLPALSSLFGAHGHSTASFWKHFLAAPRLEIVNLSLEAARWAYEGTSERSEILQIIGSSCPHLRTLAVSYIVIGESHTEDLIRPLFQCRNLVRLELSSVPHQDISYTITDDMLELSNAFPDLEVLHLGGPVSIADTVLGQRPPLSLLAISRLSTKCPRLRSLKLTVDAENCPTTPSLTYSSLKTFDLGYSWIKDPQRIAAWLGDFCPADGLVVSKESYMWAEETDKRLEMWGEVKELLKAQQSSRI
jgi:hypothetical protein